MYFYWTGEIVNAATKNKAIKLSQLTDEDLLGLLLSSQQMLATGSGDVNYEDLALTKAEVLSRMSSRTKQ